MQCYIHAWLRMILCKTERVHVCIQEKETMSIVKKVPDRFGMQDCKPRETPCEPKPENAENAEKMQEPRKYRGAVGSLIYLSTCTRPDISFVVSKVSQYFAEPTVEHWKTVKRVQIPQKYN